VIRQNSGRLEDPWHSSRPSAAVLLSLPVMFRFIVLCLGTLARLRARRSILLENLALRHQLAFLKHSYPSPSLGLLDKPFWVAMRRFWSGRKPSLIVVTPGTVVRWHRAGFRNKRAAGARALIPLLREPRAPQTNSWPSSGSLFRLMRRRIAPCFVPDGSLVTHSGFRTINSTARPHISLQGWQ
jgi:hypothetical protein